MKNPSRVLGIVGSPRKGGNTDILVEKVLEGASDRGASVDKIVLTNFRIRPCTACDTCRRKKKCIHDDDMPGILRKMQEYDTWVLGTPLYFWGPTAQFKTFLDRWYGLFNTLAVRFEDRRIILVIPFEESDPAEATYIIGMFTKTIQWAGADLFSIVLAPGVHERGAVNHRNDLLEKAYHTGRSAASTDGGTG